MPFGEKVQALEAAARQVPSNDPVTASATGPRDRCLPSNEHHVRRTAVELAALSVMPVASALPARRHLSLFCVIESNEAWGTARICSGTGDEHGTSFPLMTRRPSGASASPAFRRKSMLRRSPRSGGAASTSVLSPTLSTTF